MPKFSIITVCLNEEQAIRRTCESICSQTYDDYEWIVIDGESSDGTLGVLTDYKLQISHLVSEPDRGIYDAMNKGITLAQGAYLVFLNAGDCFSESNILKVVAQAPESDLLYGDLLCTTVNGSSFVKTFPDTLPKYFLLKNMMPHQASFIRRDLFHKYGFYNTSYKIAGDYDLFVRLLYVHRVSSFHIDKVLAVFHVDGVSSHASQRAIRKKENHSIRKKYFPWFIYGLKRLKGECKFWIGQEY